MENKIEGREQKGICLDFKSEASSELHANDQLPRLGEFVPDKDVNRLLESIPCLTLSKWMHFLECHSEELHEVGTKDQYCHFQTLIESWREAGYPDPELWQNPKYISSIQTLKEYLQAVQR